MIGGGRGNGGSGEDLCKDVFPYHGGERGYGGEGKKGVGDVFPLKPTPGPFSQKSITNDERRPKRPSETNVNVGGWIVDQMTEEFRSMRSKFRVAPEQLVRMTCIVFARGDSDLAKKELIPLTQLWHERSADFLDVFLIGFSFDASSDFDSKLFASAQTWMEKHTKWRRGGGADIIIFNTVLEKGKQRASIQWESAICINSEAALKSEAFLSLEAFFETMIGFARQYQGQDPTWGFSDSLGGKKIKSGLWHLVLSFMPEALRKDAESAKHFCVRSIA